MSQRTPTVAPAAETRIQFTTSRRSMRVPIATQPTTGETFKKRMVRVERKEEALRWVVPMIGCCGSRRMAR